MEVQECVGHEEIVNPSMAQSSVLCLLRRPGGWVGGRGSRAGPAACII